MSPNIILGKTPVSGLVDALRSPSIAPIEKPPIEPDFAAMFPENDADPVPVNMLTVGFPLVSYA